MSQDCDKVDGRGVHIKTSPVKFANISSHAILFAALQGLLFTAESAAGSK